jgi:hypothetical protein
VEEGGRGGHFVVVVVVGVVVAIAELRRRIRDSVEEV